LERDRVKTIPSRRTAAARVQEGGVEIERFESLVDELSAVMAQTSANAVDAQIETWLARICLALDLDRSAIYQRDGRGEAVRTTHTWLRKDFPPFPRNYDPETLFKGTTAWVMAGNQLVFSDPEEIPPQLADAKRFVERYGPKASAIIPMFAGDRVIGAASFGRFRSPRTWDSRLLERLGLVVRIFGGAIERKQAVIASQAARAELALAQRRSMAGELVGSLAHELSQPLTAILSNLQGLARLLSQDRIQPTALKNAIQDTKRAGEIVRRVRAMFRSEVAHKVSIDVHSLLKEVVELVRNEAVARGVALRIEDSTSPSRVQADRIQIQQCVMNLLMNALDATSETASGPREITIRVAPENVEWLAVSVSDTGDGIDPAVKTRVFEPFTTTKARGMGLGLLVTRSIVEGHGGRVWFTANQDRGTTFAFTLPIAREERTARHRLAKTRRHQ
jgi:signal transduction histidine kinase